MEKDKIWLHFEQPQRRKEIIQMLDSILEEDSTQNTSINETHKLIHDTLIEMSIPEIEYFIKVANSHINKKQIELKNKINMFNIDIKDSILLNETNTESYDYFGEVNMSTEFLKEG